MQALEIGRAADPHERGGAASMQAELSQTCRREAGKCGARGRRVQGRSVHARLQHADDEAFQLPRAPRLDELTAESTQQRLRDGWQPELPHALEASRRLPDERISCEALQKLAVVGVHRDHEPQPFETLFALRAHDDSAVEPLPS